MLPRSTLLSAQMLPALYTVGYAILYCATPRLHYCWGRCFPFLHGWRRDPLLCHPPLHYCWDRCCPLLFCGWRRDPLLCYPPLHYCWGRYCPFFVRLAARPFTWLPLYTTPGLSAACFGAMRVGVLGDPSLCYPPTPHLGEMLPVLTRWV